MKKFIAFLLVVMVCTTYAAAQTQTGRRKVPISDSKSVPALISEKIGDGSGYAIPADKRSKVVQILSAYAYKLNGIQNRPVRSLADRKEIPNEIQAATEATKTSLREVPLKDEGIEKLLSLARSISNETGRQGMSEL